MARTTNETTFASLIALIGFDRAHIILHEEEEKHGLRISPTKAKTAAKQGAAVLAHFGAEVKKGGAPIDPNSTQQRVWAEVTKMLKQAPNGINMREKWESLSKKLGVSEVVFKRNALKTPGVERTYGVWKLV